MKKHLYKTNIIWQGNQGKGTAGYKTYGRDHLIRIPNKTMEIQGSADPSFLGDPSKYNPEELFLSSLSTCHMLWYLHLCSTHNIIVLAYEDDAQGVMHENKDGSGQFDHVTLYPKVSVQTADMKTKALSLHQKAHEMCFIARSCNFTVNTDPEIIVIEQQD